MQNYFNYFTEIEHRFQQRRGSILMLSTLDWALIETWRDSGLPLDAVLRGIDHAFDKHEASKHRPGTRRINGLAWCSQAVMESFEQAREAATGTLSAAALEAALKAAEDGFEPQPVAAYLNENAAILASVTLPGVAAAAAVEASTRLRQLAAAIAPDQSLEDLDRTLTVLEEKLQNALQMAAPEDQLVALREQATRELAPYRGRMKTVQIRQVQQQFLHKRLFEAYRLPRLSLFYMRHA